jgi:Secretion system C-terminal sorting domain
MKKFYKVLLSCCLLGGAFHALNAQVLLTESFDGTGLSNWSSTGSGGSFVTQTDPTFGLGQSIKVSLPASATNFRYDRSLPMNILGDGTDGTSYWIGFYYRSTTTAATTGTGVNTTGIAAQIVLTNSTLDPAISGSMPANSEMRLGFGKTSNLSASNAITIFTRANPGNCTAANNFNTTINSQDKYYILAKVTKGEYPNINVGTMAMPVLETLDGIRIWVIPITAAPLATDVNNAISARPNGDATQNTGSTAVQSRMLRLSGNSANTTCRASGATGLRIRVESSGGMAAFTAEFDELRVAANLNDVLPIELADISAYKKGVSNIVKWTTASETNNKGFHIERSSNASTWETIGFVKGAGNAQQKIDYSFTDNSPLSISYYRLRQEDNDGRMTNTKVVSVSQNGKLNVKIAPNPAKDVVNISLDKESEKNFVTVYDVVGRSVATAQFSGVQSELNVSNLIKGIYFINVQSEGKSITQKFFKE